MIIYVILGNDTIFNRVNVEIFLDLRLWVECGCGKFELYVTSHKICGY